MFAFIQNAGSAGRGGVRAQEQRAQATGSPRHCAMYCYSPRPCARARRLHSADTRLHKVPKRASITRMPADSQRGSREASGGQTSGADELESETRP